jgi:hypothetical protein
MKTDMQLKADILAELKWEIFVKVKLINVGVNNGEVTLVGLDSLDFMNVFTMHLKPLFAHYLIQMTCKSPYKPTANSMSQI